MLRKKLREEPPRDGTIFDRPFWRFFSALGDFFLLNIYWLFTSLPLVTIGVSTSALFYVCLKKRRHEEGNLWQMYKKSFLENLKQGTFIWLLYIFVAVDVFIIGLILCQRGVLHAEDFARNGRHYFSLVIVILMYLGVMLYTAALLAMFRQTTIQCIQAAVGMTFSQLPSTLLFLLILLALWTVTFYLFPALIFIDIPLAVYLISIRINTIFQKQISRVEKIDNV